MKPVLSTRDRSIVFDVRNHHHPGDKFSPLSFSITRGGFLWSGGISRTPVINLTFFVLLFFITGGGFRTLPPLSRH